MMSSEATLLSFVNVTEQVAKWSLAAMLSGSAAAVFYFDRP